jgi:Na+-transporting NADH:ubiquinone oxidoreductase subunit F
MILGLSTAGTVLVQHNCISLCNTVAGNSASLCQEETDPQGDVTLTINDKELTVSPGSTILNTLSGNQIFLPSACGGGGTCGMCKCQVVEGGGSILPTEVSFFTRREQQENWRLGCQVKIREDMKIKVPESIMGSRSGNVKLYPTDNVATFIKEFVVKLPEGETSILNREDIFRSMFRNMMYHSAIWMLMSEYRDDWDKLGLWDLKVKNTEETYRAYSMANHPGEGNIIMLNIRIATPPWDNVKKQFMKVPVGTLLYICLHPKAWR